jgi:hypothetical protein
MHCFQFEKKTGRNGNVSIQDFSSSLCSASHLEKWLILTLCGGKVFTSSINVMCNEDLNLSHCRSKK